MGFASDNINWRNWMLTAAHELEGKYDGLPYRGGAGFSSEDILAGLPLENLLQFLAVRVAAERCFDAHHLIALTFTPDDKSFVLELRRGVLQVHASPAEAVLERVSGALTLTRQAFIALGRGTPIMELAAQASVRMTRGDTETLAQLLACLDPQPAHPAKLASR